MEATKTKGSNKTQSVLSPETKKSSNYKSMLQTFKKFAKGISTSQMVF